MKALKSLFLLLALNVFACVNIHAQGKYTQGDDSQTGAGGICNYTTGQCVNFWYPTGLAAQTVIFPGSFNYQYAHTAVTSTIFDTITTSSTYFKKDSLVGGTVIKFNIDQYVTQGATLTLQLGAASDSSRVIYVYQDATPIDTVTVTNHKKHTSYVYDGTLLQAIYK